MPNNENLHTVVMDKFFEGFALKKDGALKVVNEDAAKQASSALSKIVLEQARDWWGQLEAAEDSLSNIADEISFEELNTDTSSQEMSHGSISDGDDEPVMPEPEEMTMESADLKNLLGSEDFDLSSIFEMDDMDDEDDDADGEVVDGDEEMDDLKLGMDSMSGEDGEDADMRDLGDEDGMDELEDMDDDDFGDESVSVSLDPEADPEMGEYGDEEEFDFDLGSDDEGLDFDDDDEEDMDEMRGRHHAMESDDEDDEDDDDEDEDED